jgi:hypothetical protein
MKVAELETELNHGMSMLILWIRGAMNPIETSTLLLNAKLSDEQKMQQATR